MLETPPERLAYLIEKVHNPLETRYLVGTSLLADYLEEAITALRFALPD